MYGFLRQNFGSKLANYAAPILYSLMVLAVIYCIFEPQAQFNYLRL